MSSPALASSRTSAVQALAAQGVPLLLARCSHQLAPSPALTTPFHPCPPRAPCRLLRVVALSRRAHGDPFRLISAIPGLAKSFNYSTRLVVVAASALLLALHYFACGLWLLLRIEVCLTGEGERVVATRAATLKRR